MNTHMMNYLLENDVTIKCESRGRAMTADETFIFGGEFVVYSTTERDGEELYRGQSFENASEMLQKL